jgi:hypothetical protein
VSFLLTKVESTKYFSAQIKSPPENAKKMCSTKKFFLPYFLMAIFNVEPEPIYPSLRRVVLWRPI